ncbi:MAG: glycosyltransferase [Flavobacteriales bacterium]
MKFAYLSTFHPFRGGIAQFNARLMRELEHQGHTVNPYTFTTQYPERLFPGKTQLVTPEDVADPINAPRVLSSVGPLSWITAADRIAQEAPDVLLMKYWMSFFGPSLGTVAGRLRKRGTRVITVLDNVVPHEGRFFDTPFTHYFLRRNDGFVAMSEKVKADLLSFVPDARVELLPHPLYDHFGARIPTAEARRQLGIAEGRRVLLFFGFIRDYKGLDLLIEAMAKLPKDIVLVIAGEPYGDMTKYHDAIQRLGLKDRIVDHIRYIADQEVPRFFSAADVVVLPYRSATQSGITAIAQHFATPIIATDVGGLKELVADGRTGIIVPTADPVAIAAGVERFYTMGPGAFAEGLARLREELSWERFAQRLVEFAGSLGAATTVRRPNHSA